MDAQTHSNWYSLVTVSPEHCMNPSKASPTRPGDGAHPLPLEPPPHKPEHDHLPLPNQEFLLNSGHFFPSNIFSRNPDNLACGVAESGGGASERAMADLI